MSEETEILKKLKDIISTQLNIEIDKITPTSNFTKELGADSLDVVELVMAFEEAFEIDIADEAALDIATVQDVVDYIENKN